MNQIDLKTILQYFKRTLPEGQRIQLKKRLNEDPIFREEVIDLLEAASVEVLEEQRLLANMNKLKDFYPVPKSPLFFLRKYGFVLGFAAAASVLIVIVLMPSRQSQIDESKRFNSYKNDPVAINTPTENSINPELESSSNKTTSIIRSSIDSNNSRNLNMDLQDMPKTPNIEHQTKSEMNSIPSNEIEILLLVEEIDRSFPAWEVKQNFFREKFFELVIILKKELPRQRGVLKEDMQRLVNYCEQRMDQH